MQMDVAKNAKQRISFAAINRIIMLVIPFLPHLIKWSYPAEIDLTVLYLIYLGSTVISNFLFAYKSSHTAERFSI